MRIWHVCLRQDKKYMNVWFKEEDDGKEEEIAEEEAEEQKEEEGGGGGREANIVCRRKYEN